MTLIFLRAEEALSELLALVSIEVGADEIADWSEWKLHRAEEWAGAVILHESLPDCRVPPMPGFLAAFDRSAAHS